MAERRRAHPKNGRTRGLLFSPSSSYPIPVAYVVDDDGSILHTWTHTAHQALPEEEPPNYLRGWNHVEVDAEGNLFAIVPLHSLLKLSPDSRLVWSSDVAAHHDLAITHDGSILVLAEAPRRIPVDDGTYVVLDNVITTLDRDGTVRDESSLFDVLRTDPGLRRRIDDSVRLRREAFARRRWPTPDDQVSDAVVRETLSILQTGCYEGERRQALRRLRDLPGSPCDVLHTNTLEVLPAHPAGLWNDGDVMVAMRDLNTIAVIDVARAQVRWSWGHGQLSGPHQPSQLPNGDVLVFDNGRDIGRTRLLIVNPSTGHVVWSWTADAPESFFCPLAGGCRRLPNGNLLVTNSTAGAGFELTMDGRIVWRLTLPVEVFGAQRGRVSIYRMSVVDDDVLVRLAPGLH